MRYANKAAVAVAAVLAGASGAALAEAPKLSEVLQASGITATGYVSASYYHSSELNTWHQFDTQANTFQLDQAGFTVAYQPTEGFGALVNVIAGEDARVLNSAENGHDNTMNLTQAFVQYATGPLTVIAGKYTTLAGAEVIAPTGNTNFSRSLMFWFEPLTHTGVRATVKANDMFSFTAGVNNGWNVTSESDHHKTAEVGVSFTPAPIFSLAAAGYFGDEGAGRHDLVDLVATITPIDPLSFVVSYDYNKQKIPGDGSVKWQEVAVYVNYKFTDQFRISVRGEIVDDKDGALTGTDQKIKETTVTFGYAPTSNFELRLEARKDKSGDSNVFIKKDAFSYTNTPNYTDSQTGFAVQGLYKF